VLGWNFVALAPEVSRLMPVSTIASSNVQTQEIECMSTKKQTGTAKTATPKSASITLRANGAVLTLAAVRKDDGSAVTTVTTRDTDKKASRGMTESHKSIADAKAYLSTLAEKAEKAGWKRGTFAAAAKPDAFSKLPAPPKVATA
jgi:hypothetical protein